jgi:hypothetical protein
MDGLAEAVVTAAGWSVGELGAVYFETEADGLEALSEPDAGLALVTLPFFLEHREALGLEARAMAVPAERQGTESWSLVAAAGALKSSADLANWELRSLAGHSPRFIRGPALGSWGTLPEDMRITFSGAVLSSLRKAARGEKVAVLLDAHQASALERLPFADKLQVVHESPAMPVSLLCTVAGRIDESRGRAVIAALLGLAERPEAAEALAGVRMDRFAEVDQEALERARSAFDELSE